MNAIRTTKLGLSILGVLLALFAMPACGDDEGEGEEQEKIACSAVDDGCTCNAYSNGQSDPGVTCSPETFPGTLCCADQNWPDTLPSTSCHCLTNEDGSTPTSCQEISYAGEVLPGLVDACDLDHSPN